MFNTLLRHVGALGERTAAELKQRWPTLQYVTLSPSQIGDIARAALVLNGIWSITRRANVARPRSPSPPQPELKPGGFARPRPVRAHALARP